MIYSIAFESRVGSAGPQYRILTIWGLGGGDNILKKSNIYINFSYDFSQCHQKWRWGDFKYTSQDKDVE